jgi:7-cyano-7-deazaguanine synthase
MHQAIQRIEDKKREYAKKRAERAIVVFSGGQDSTTCLLLARHAHRKITALHFVYGQRHEEETKRATKLCLLLGVELVTVDISFVSKLVTSALTGDGDVNDAHPNDQNLPASFVPGRNAMFLTIAHALAQERGAAFIYTGVCETDYSGYPDCRALFVSEIELALNTGYQTNITIQTPLMYLNKAQTFMLADELGHLRIVLRCSHTCYNNSMKDNRWGYGCGNCPACRLRAAGYDEFIAATRAEGEPC